jgi:hypothetical protein
MHSWGYDSPYSIQMLSDFKKMYKWVYNIEYVIW